MASVRSVFLYFLLRSSAATEEASCELQHPELEAKQYALDSYEVHAAHVRDVDKLEQRLQEEKAQWKGAEGALNVYEEVLGEERRHEEAQKDMALRLANSEISSSQEAEGIVTVLDLLNAGVGIETDADESPASAAQKDVDSSPEPMECAESIVISGADDAQPHRMGVFRQLPLPGAALHRSIPMYLNDHGVFLFYWAPYKDWLVGSNTSYGIASTGDLRAPCPELASGWKVFTRGKWIESSVTVVDESAHKSVAAEPEPIDAPSPTDGSTVVTGQDIKVASESTSVVAF